MLDRLLRTVAPEGGTPEALVKFPFAMMLRAVDLLRFAVPSRSSATAFLEFMNKLEAFTTFEREPSRCVPTATEGSGWSCRPQRPGAYTALWATEGWGYSLAEDALKCGDEPARLLAEGRYDLPEASLIPLHSGMGLAFATRLLRPLRPSTPPRDVRAALERFVALCEQNSRAGYAEGATEALGLATRTIHPLVVPLIDSQLPGMRADLSGYFWHGIGRGLYFVPTNILPSSYVGWPGVAKAAREAPHEVGRCNATAGLAWALMLVNVRNPSVLELFLARHGDGLAASAAFANGIRSAAQVWKLWAPASPDLNAIRQHRPDPRNPAVVHLWDVLIRRACEDDFQAELDALRGGQRLGTLFHDRPPGSWRQPSANAQGLPPQLARVP